MNVLNLTIRAANSANAPHRVTGLAGAASARGGGRAAAGWAVGRGGGAMVATAEANREIMSTNETKMEFMKSFGGRGVGR